MRHNPLASGRAAKPRRVARTTTPKTPALENRALWRTVTALSVETFACLMATADLHEARQVRAAFAAWCAAHSKCRDWRHAWRNWRPAAGKPRPALSAAEKAIANLRNL